MRSGGVMLKAGWREIFWIRKGLCVSVGGGRW